MLRANKTAVESTAVRNEPAVTELNANWQRSDSLATWC